MERVEVGVVAGPGAGSCRLCLSTERALSAVGSERWAYRAIDGRDDGEAGVEVEVAVCWECRAELRRVLRLRRQALRARQLLERAQGHRTTADPIVTKCLSRLCSETKIYYDLDISYNRDGRNVSVSGGPKAEVESCDEAAPDFEFHALPDLELTYKNIVTPRSDNAGNKNAQEVIDNKAKRKSTDNHNRNKEKKRRNKDLARVAANKAEKPHKMLKPNVKRCKLQLPEICDKITGDAKQISSAWHNYRKSLKLGTHPHKCNDCVQKFKDAGEEKKHIADFHSVEAGEYACETCSRRFASPALAAAHVDSHARLLACKRCSYSTVTGVDMKVHHRKHLGMKRANASEEKRIVAEMPIHLKNSSGAGFDCEICGLHVKTWLYFKIHYKTHTNPRPYQCDLCGTVYKMRNQLLRHIKMHEKRFLCEICGKSCAEYPHLKLHLLSHSGLDERPHACTLCSRKFITKDKLVIHLTMHEGVKPFECDVCAQKFRVRADLRRHEREKHQIGEPIKRKPFKRTKSLYRNKPLCLDEKSGEPKVTSKRIKETKRTRGVRQDFYQCNICAKKFSHKVGLDAHAVVHTGERPFKCNECDLTFKFQSGLWSHKLIHKGLKQYQCPVCGAQFTLKGNLTGHLKIHTNDKPFECEICGQKFPWRRNLRNHYKIHNK